MNPKSHEKHYEKAIEKLIEEASIPEAECAANMLAQLEAEMDNNSGCNLKKSDADKVGRNDLCPCGSGKKYKRCCGR